MQVTEKRRKLDLEGYAADLNSMKKKINFYQKYINKLRKLAEENQDGLFKGIEEDDDEEIDN